MVPSPVREPKDLHLWHSRLLNDGPASPRSTLYALVSKGALGRMKAAKLSGAPAPGGGMGKLELAAEMPVHPKYSFCAFDRPPMALDEYRSEAQGWLRKFGEIRSSTALVGVGDAMERARHAGYGLDAPSGNGRPGASFPAPDVADLIALTQDGYGYGLHTASHYISVLLSSPHSFFPFAMRDAARRVAAFLVAQHIYSIPVGQGGPIPVFVLANALTRRQDRGKGLMTVLYHSAVEFVTRVAKGPVVLLTEATADNDAILKVAARAGFLPGGCLPAFHKCHGRPVPVDLLYFPAGRI